MFLVPLVCWTVTANVLVPPCIVRAGKLQASLQFSQMKVQFKSPENLGQMLSRLKSWICRSTAQAKFDMHYNSFVVEYASHLTLSAADHVHVLWAHLTAGNKKTCKHLHDGFWYGPPSFSILSWALRCRCIFSR
jgi:hypothetical protein